MKVTSFFRNASSEKSFCPRKISIRSLHWLHWLPPHVRIHVRFNLNLFCVSRGKTYALLYNKTTILAYTVTLLSYFLAFRT